MKISIIPDCHCGYGQGKRHEDSFLALEEVIEKNLDSDLILIVGDLFNSRIPKQETFGRVAKTLVKVQNIPSQTKFIDVIGKDRKDMSPSALKGIPIVAINGNHDRRSKHMVNPVQLLEKSGLLMHLHCGTVIFEIHGQKVAVHGMSNVPERYAKDVMYKWGPKPVENAVNILLIHQSIDPYIYSPLEPPSIKLEDLPGGFDLVIDGHIHWHDTKTLGGSLFLLTGSLAPTSLHKKESEQKKGWFVYNGTTVEFKSVENQRKIYWEDLYFNENIKSDLNRKISDIISRDSGKLEPIIKINVKGSLPKGMNLPSFADVERKFRDKAVLRLSRKLKQEGFEEQVELLKALRERRLSPEEQGLVILRENLKQAKCNLNTDEIFEPLMDGEIDKILSKLIQ